MSRRVRCPEFIDVTLGAGMAVRSDRNGEMYFVLLDEDDREIFCYWEHLDEGWRKKLLKVLKKWK